MRVLVLVKATEDSEKGDFPEPWTAEMMAAMGRFNDELRDAGILRAGDGLKPSSQGKRISFDGAGRTVIDGPFTATRELVAGFWLWEVKDMDEAVAWVKRCPNPMPGPSEIEIRPLYEPAEFGKAGTRTLIAQAYAAFNRRDIDGVLALMSSAVDWPKASEGGRAVGKEEIRDYWTRQWAEFDPRVEPLEVIDREAGRTDVKVHQVVKSLNGDVISDQVVLHVYTITSGLIERMDIGEAEAPFGHL